MWQANRSVCDFFSWTCFVSKPTWFPAVQVNSADQRLRVFDSTQRRWREVCSSSADELLAGISCEEVGFVRWDILLLLYSVNVV